MTTTFKTLSVKTVLGIRTALNLGTLSQRAIARKFRTSQASVSRIGNYLQRANVVA